MAYGLYDCDAYVYTPNIYQPDYVDALIEICKTHKIDLIIPGMDDEAHIFARNIHKFDAAGIKVIVAGEALLDLCRDKEKMSNELNKIANVFVKSFDKDGFIKALEVGDINYPAIAKPRGGFASRGIEIINSASDISRITDTHIVQELAVPHKGDPECGFYDRQLKKNINPQVAELSIHLVADQQGEIIGRTMTYNKLNNGVPIEIIPYENEAIWAEIFKLYPTFKELGLKGPFNLQGRLTDNGLKLFEMNARFTGITGLRAYMGFNEVEACLAEWLGLRKANTPLTLNPKRFGIRQTADKSVSSDRNPEVAKLYEQLNGAGRPAAKTLLITGATGYLGRNLIDSLIANNEPFNIWALVRNKEKAKEILPDTVLCFDEQDIALGALAWGNVDILLHAGFARPHCSLAEIAESLRFTTELFSKAIANQVASIINISSQSVYGQASLPPWTEQSIVAPESVYGTAKYASELLLAGAAKQHPHLRHTSIRLGTVAGGAKGLLPTDVISKLVAKAIKSEPINIVGGKQEMERIDVRDAVSGVIAVLKTSDSIWKPVYNLGSAQPISLIELAEQITEVVAAEKNIARSEILVEEKEIRQAFGLSTDAFCTDFNWKPAYSYKDMIRSVIEFVG